MDTNVIFCLLPYNCVTEEIFKSTIQCLQTTNVSMAAEFVSCSLTSQKKVRLRQPIKKMDSYDSQSHATRTYDFVMTRVGNRMINMTLVMLFLVGNKHIYFFK